MSTLTPLGPKWRRHARPTSDPYERLRGIITEAKAGRPPAIKEEPVNIGQPEPRHTYRPEGPLSEEQKIAHALIGHDTPFSIQIPVTNVTDQELKNAQQSGTRWLARVGHPGLRISYRRRGTDAVWVLAAKPGVAPADLTERTTR